MAPADSRRHGNARDKAETTGAAKAGRVLSAVVDALERENDIDAVRLLKDGIAHAIAPDDARLLGWLVKNMGKDHAGRLVTAFAGHPCFYCKQGLEPCEPCEGHGHRKDGALCERCLTIGVARCDFCDGAGYLQYIAIPAGLRLAVGLERTRLAAGKLAALLKQPVPHAAPDDPMGSMKTAAQELLQLNRELGILENAYTSAREMVRGRVGSKELPTKIATTSLRYAVAGFKRTRELLECMALCAESELQSPDLADPARKLAEERSVFFRRLLKPGSTFPGTLLEHSVLQSAISKLKARKRG